MATAPAYTHLLQRGLGILGIEAAMRKELHRLVLAQAKLVVIGHASERRLPRSRHIAARQYCCLDIELLYQRGCSVLLRGVLEGQG